MNLNSIFKQFTFCIIAQIILEHFKFYAFIKKLKHWETLTVTPTHGPDSFPSWLQTANNKAFFSLSKHILAKKPQTCLYNSSGTAFVVKF